MKNIAVIGAGTMGNGIAHVFALQNISVLLVDVSLERCQNALKIIEKNMARQVNKAIISQKEAGEAMENIRIADSLQKCAEAELVIEAASENKELKKKIFAELDEICPETTLFATNTSSISITEIAAVTRRPEKFIGMHFMNPVPVMKLVEIIRGYSTSDATAAEIVNLTKTLGKVPVEVQDYPGFISNRILMPMINEAIFALWEGVAARESIDEVMKLGMAHPMGPLTLADFIGLDVCLAIMNVLYNGFNDPKYRPCPLLVNMVNAGKLGRKAGQGFYSY